jgi:crossover junction endodeoxyribonuclease RuvC
VELFNSPAVVLAIDPGLSGAVCRLGGGHFDLRRDFKVGADIARAIRDLAGGVTHAVMEFVHAMPGQGVCSMFSFGRSSGVADGALALCVAVPVEQVSPQKWQGFFRQRLDIPKGADFDSRAVASSILPMSVPYLKRKLDHNSADAILIAAWKLLSPV